MNKRMSKMQYIGHHTLLKPIFHASVHTYISSGFPKSVLKYAASVQRYISLHLVDLKKYETKCKCNLIFTT